MMTYKILADLIVLLHFVWVSFMLAGSVVTLLGFIWRRLFDLSVLRTVHLLGILYVVLLIILDKPCPLTTWENDLMAKYNPSLTYPGSFIAHWLERVVYPDVDPLVVYVLTLILALTTVVLFVFRPPSKLKRYFHRRTP